MLDSRMPYSNKKRYIYIHSVNYTTILHTARIWCLLDPPPLALHYQTFLRDFSLARRMAQVRS